MADAQGTSPQFRRRASRPVGRVLCTRLRGPAAIHLGLPLPAASCGLPASIGRAALKRSRRPRGRNREALLTLLRVGFTKPPQSPAALVVSYTTVSPLPPARPEAVCFLWHFPAGHPGSALPTTLPCGARTFLGAARCREATRPPGRLARRCVQDRASRGAGAPAALRRGAAAAPTQQAAAGAGETSAPRTRG